jgi:Fe2+ or Zn2+ uptake regulation protein
MTGHKPHHSDAATDTGHAAADRPLESAELHTAVRARLAVSGQQYPATRRRLVELLAAGEAPQSIPDLLRLDTDLAQSSVYRNLAVLEEAGILERIVTGDEFARFELAEELSGHHHHHLICTRCGGVTDVTLPAAFEHQLDTQLAVIAAAHSFTPSAHQCDVIGICEQCAAAASAG